MAKDLLLVLISGSIREPSFSRELTLELQSRLEAHRVCCEHWDPRIRTVPACDPLYHDAPEDNPAPWARELAELVRRADGFVLSTPVYHNSYSGILKNILDHLTIEQVRYKPIALLSHGGLRATHAVDHLRIVVRGLLGIALPSQVCTARQDFEESDPAVLRLVAPDISQRLTRTAVELVTFAQLLRPLREAQR